MATDEPFTHNHDTPTRRPKGECPVCDNTATALGVCVTYTATRDVWFSVPSYGVADQTDARNLAIQEFQRMYPKVPSHAITKIEVNGVDLR